jgi:hypothetical protein
MQTGAHRNDKKNAHEKSKEESSCISKQDLSATELQMAVSVESSHKQGVESIPGRISEPVCWTRALETPPRVLHDINSEIPELTPGWGSFNPPTFGAQS